MLFHYITFYHSRLWEIDRILFFIYLPVYLLTNIFFSYTIVRFVNVMSIIHNLFVYTLFKIIGSIMICYRVIRQIIIVTNLFFFVQKYYYIILRECRELLRAHCCNSRTNLDSLRRRLIVRSIERIDFHRIYHERIRHGRTKVNRLSGK